MPGPQLVVRESTETPALETAVTFELLLDHQQMAVEVHDEVLLPWRLHVVHVREVRAVEDVLGHVLDVDAHAVGVGAPRRPFLLALAELQHVVAGCLAPRVEPDVHEAVPLLHRMRACTHARRRLAEPRHLDQAARAVVAPAVEGTADAISDHAPAHAEMRTEVRTVRVEDAGAAVLAAEQHQVAAEVAQRPHLTRCEIGREADPVPAVGRRREGVAGHAPAQTAFSGAMSPGSSFRPAMPAKPSPAL